MTKFNEIVKNIVNSYVAGATILFSFTKDIVVPLIPFAQYIFVGSLLLLLITVLIKRSKLARKSLLSMAAVSLVVWGGHWVYENNADIFRQGTAVSILSYSKSAQ